MTAIGKPDQPDQGDTQRPQFAEPHFCGGTATADFKPRSGRLAAAQTAALPANGLGTAGVTTPSISSDPTVPARSS
jgi:hypothetical protein